MKYAWLLLALAAVPPSSAPEPPAHTGRNGLNDHVPPPRGRSTRGSTAGRSYRRADGYEGPGRARTPEEKEAVAKAEAKRARRAAKRRELRADHHRDDTKDEAQ